eukprot:MONOS_16702.1-p1 / transcript=MONOS_16702.1 / gene=MONOS_16702 / organism=Monocercomonoides_exilis_PA203 / gene_product=unspecified product / transcript_product=unspecified product / location=Mono_scaffold02036:371-742(-) / protein_length=124 / sequence_SO=supercontig / SO=protein_coding / is_pseudo=false
MHTFSAPPSSFALPSTSVMLHHKNSSFPPITLDTMHAPFPPKHPTLPNEQFQNSTPLPSTLPSPPDSNPRSNIGSSTTNPSNRVSSTFSTSPLKRIIAYPTLPCTPSSNPNPHFLIQSSPPFD